jgi:hypothetical protein
MLITDRVDRTFRDSLSDEQVGVERKMRTMLLNGSERHQEYRPVGDEAVDVRGTESVEVAILWHVRMVPVEQANGKKAVPHSVDERS